MKRSLPTLISLLLLSGCATTGSNYYNYEGSGDYYYGASAADAVINASPYGYGWAGSNYGYGYGFGAGSGYGRGYGSGWGYGWPYTHWGYGYQPIWLLPTQPHPGDSRDTRVERDRAVRAGLVRRDTVQAPGSAKWQRVQPASRGRFLAPSASRGATADRRSSSRSAPTPRSAAPVRSRSFRSSPPSMSRSAPPPAPVRSAPSPRPTSRRE